MFPRIPEYTLVTLLRQCYTASQCGRTTAFRLTARPTSSQSFHRACLSLHPRQTETRQTGPISKQKTAGLRKVHTGANGVAHAQDQRAHIITRHGEDEHEHNLLAKQYGSAAGAAAPVLEETGSDRIAVLGGGITGLAAAYYMTKEQPNAKIDIYEASNRLGGWLNSKKVQTLRGSVVFEQGPRTLRPKQTAGKVTLALISDLRLEDQLIITPTDSDAARNRFIYYPDHLVKMPGPGQDPSSLIWSLMTEPIFKGIGTAFFEMFKPARASSMADESVGSFLERRLGGPEIVDNVVSAVLHGIYAGDIYKLSAKSLLPLFWEYEERYGSILSGAVNTAGGTGIMRVRDSMMYDAANREISDSLRERMRSASVYTFKNGISALSGAIEESLRSNPNVCFKLGNQVTNIHYDEGLDRIQINTNKNLPVAVYSNVISTISARTLSHLANNLTSLRSTQSATVMVVNLFYPDPFLLDERGFGYLIPRSVAFDQNPECALGVVFDSETTTGQDDAIGTKVTVMLGGHWWDGYETYPDEDEGIQMAMNVLKRHLKIDVEPEVVNVGLHKDCIPQYHVGHHGRMMAGHEELMTTFGGRLAVVGNSYAGVGLNDCIREARTLVADLCYTYPDGESHVYNPIPYSSGDPPLKMKMKLGDLHRVSGLEQFTPNNAVQYMELVATDNR